MVGELFDSNILIDAIKGIEAGAAEIRRADDPAISIVTWIEVLVGGGPDELPRLRAFLGTFKTIQLDPEVAEEAAALRRSHRMRLPDAVVWASARLTGRRLVTRNTKDFPETDPSVRVPYRV